MPKEILVVRFGSLGDVILTSATVLNLKLNYPASRLIFFTKERFRTVVECFDGVDEVVTLPDGVGGREFLSLLMALDGRGFDVVIDLHGNLRSWLTRRVVSARRRLVYPKRRLERFLATKRKGLSDNHCHTVDLYNDVARRLGQQVLCHRPLMQVKSLPEDVGTFLQRGRKTVVFAPGAAHTNKRWPLDRFVDVAKRLHSSHHLQVMWAVTSSDTGGANLAGLFPDGDSMELVDFPVDQLAAVLARAELTIANDSGIGHLSSAAGTPVLAIFGPTHAVLGFAPRGLHDRVIGVDEYCRPCSLHGKKPCFREERFCLTRISPEQVAREAAEILDSGVNRAPALFVDRDGTVMVDKGYLSDPEQVELLKGSAEALRLAKAGSYRIVIVTNQSGVARGYFGTREVERTNGRLLELLAAEGVDVDGIYYCPHHSTEGKVPEFSIECQCRKPSSGMAEQAALDLGVDLRRSIVIGDTPADYDLGRIIGGQSLLVRTGYGAMTEEQLKSTGQMSSGCVFDDLLQAVEHVIRTKDKSSCQGQR